MLLFVFEGFWGSAVIKSRLGVIKIESLAMGYYRIRRVSAYRVPKTQHVSLVVSVCRDSTFTLVILPFILTHITHL